VFFVAAERVAERLGLRRDLEPAAALAPELSTEPANQLSTHAIPERVRKH
jgi:hypothetical protein